MYAVEIALAAAAAVLVVCYRILRIGSRENGLPPGPATSPVFGNLLQIPTKDAYRRFTVWAKDFGDIYSLKVGPGTIVVLSSPAAIKEVLDKQSAYTSDRPPMALADLVIDGWSLFLCRYSDRWRQLRKAAQNLLAPTTVKQYLPLQEAESTQLQFDILVSPDKFYAHLNRFSNSFVLAIIFGKRSPRIETPSAKAISAVIVRWDEFLGPGATPPVDIFPILQWIPERFAPWIKEAREIRRLQTAMYSELMDECQQRTDAGDGNFFMADVIRDQQTHGMTKDQMRHLAGAIYEAGSSTGSCFLQGLVLLLATYPEVQAKAHAEIDRVIGEARSPVYDDTESLPYVRALIQEAHRFRTLVPLSLAHRATRDVHYNGYLIPEGATLFGNIHAVFHDPELFDDPETFNPDRFLLTQHGTKPGVDDSNLRSTLIFGTGRRICPGMHLASVSAILATMKMLWAFEFRPPLDPATGQAIKLDIHANHGAVAFCPIPFKCDIRCRSPARAEVIRNAFKVDAASTLSAFEYNLSKEDQEWLESVRAG